MASSRLSPPTARVVAVLDHLAAQPSRRFGLSELARELGMSKPTCLGIVTELVASNYLLSEPAGGGYRLGPALLGLGRAARQGHAVAEVARRHLAPLSERYATTCTASAVVGDQIMVLERTGPAAAIRGVTIGQTYPFAPPVGLMYVLWGPETEFDSWLARPPTLPVRVNRAHLRRVAGECRARGYLVESLTPMGTQLHNLMAGVAAYDLPAEVTDLVGEMVSELGERMYLDADLGGARRHPVSLIAAPTFDADGRQDLVVTLYVGAALTGAEIGRRGQALIDAAARITAESGGSVRPDGLPAG